MTFLLNAFAFLNNFGAGGSADWELEEGTGDWRIEEDTSDWELE